MNAESGKKSAASKKETLAINGGEPVRRDPLPLEFPGIHYMDEEEINAALRVLRSRSPFRYYGVDLQGKCRCSKPNSPHTWVFRTVLQSTAEQERCIRLWLRLASAQGKR